MTFITSNTLIFILHSLLSPFFAVMFSTTHFTYAPNPTDFYQVVSGVFVSLWTMCFGTIDSNQTRPAHIVFTRRNTFNVNRVKTGFVATQVVTLVVYRQFSVYKQYVHQAMQQIASSLQRQSIVSVGMNAPVFRRVQPTRSFVAHIFDSDMRKNLSKQFNGNADVAIIQSSLWHKDNLLCNIS